MIPYSMATRACAVSNVTTAFDRDSLPRFAFEHFAAAPRLRDDRSDEDAGSDSTRATWRGGRKLFAAAPATPGDPDRFRARQSRGRRGGVSSLRRAGPDNATPV